MQETLYRNVITQLTENDVFDTPNEVIKTWDNAFYLKAESPINPLGLRNPQIGSIHSALAHWTCSNEIATIVLPTGTGKTETMLSLLILAKCEKVLVIVPTDPLREQISKKFIELGLLKTLEILDETAFYPVVGVLKKSFSNSDEATEFFAKCNVIVATASILSRVQEEIFPAFIDSFSHIFIDEAHHAEARTWFKIRDKFKDKKILQFTATPYREDGNHPAKKIIYNYPLKKAQNEGYFKPIDVFSIYEYEPKKSDLAIAEKAIEILREDKKTFNHLLLARVQTKKRADEVFEIYEKFTDFKVVKIYSGIKEKDSIKQSIKDKEADIIVCVDMLGEGFDLPQLKIAAFHDVKKSLPTTIQFVGRFTRSKFDEELENAKIVVNLADLNVKKELDALYAQDNDWNELLPQLSEGKTQKEIDFQELISGFNNVEDFVISISSLKPAMSSVIYQNQNAEWHPENFENGFANKKHYELIKSIQNNDKKVLVIITAEKLRQKWTDSPDVFDLVWTLYIVHWNSDLKLLFIHSSDKGSFYEKLAKSIIGDEARIIDGSDKGQIFRCLDGIQRFRLQNIGLKELLGKLIRFRMSVGTDIEPALTQAEIRKATKSHIFGNGFENGVSATIGCSYKGRVWSILQKDIDSFVKWCENIGRKVLDESIDPEQVLKGAIVPKSVSERPPIFPICIDWNSEMYKELETRYTFKVGEKIYDFFNSELILIDVSDTGNIKFAIENNNEIFAEFEMQIYQTEADYNDFRIIKLSTPESVKISTANNEVEIESYFYKNTPEIWFADDSVLEGCSLSKINEEIEPYQIEKIIDLDWTGVSLNKESQDVDPKITDSIQFRFIEDLKKADFDIIYDDDYSGEIADVIAIKQTDKKIIIELYHLKFAMLTEKGNLSNQIKNLYEVCGQAQKSIHWKFKDGKEFFNHLLRRKTKSYGGKTCSRIEKGTEQNITELMQLASRRIPLEFKIFIVQPAIQKSVITQEQLTLLSVTENYLNAMGVELAVIGSK